MKVNKQVFILALAAMCLAVGCKHQSAMQNPFFAPWGTPYEIPDFARIVRKQSPPTSDKMWTFPQIEYEFLPFPLRGAEAAPGCGALTRRRGGRT